jgi:hypothetical protein
VRTPPDGWERAREGGYKCLRAAMRRHRGISFQRPHTSMLSNAFWEALAIGVGAGVGLAAIFVPPTLEHRRRLNSEILEPTFNHVLDRSKHSAWEGGAEPIQSKFEPAQWLRIPLKYRGPLDELSDLTARYATDWGSYVEYMGRIGWFGESVRKGLANYVTSDGSLVRTDSMGIEGGGMPQVQTVAAGLAPYVLLNPTDTAAVCNGLHASHSGYSYWANVIVAQLEKSDPRALDATLSEMRREPGFDRARELATSVDVAHNHMLRQSSLVLFLLSKRLGFNRRSASRPRGNALNH